MGVLAVLFFCGTARADDATVDWARGLVTANGIGIADRHAPNPAVARGTSRRAAEDAAKATIAAALPKLPLAAGGKVGDKVGDKDVKARIDRAVDAAIAIAAEPETDGSWRVAMAVPIEAVREAIAGPRALPADGDAGPAVVVIDGGTGKPAVGWTVGGKSVATVWVKDVPAWARDAPHVKAKAGKHGDVEVDGMIGGDATLYVIAP